MPNHKITARRLELHVRACRRLAGRRALVLQDNPAFHICKQEVLAPLLARTLRESSSRKSQQQHCTERLLGPRAPFCPTVHEVDTKRHEPKTQAPSQVSWGNFSFLEPPDLDAHFHMDHLPCCLSHRHTPSWRHHQPAPAPSPVFPVIPSSPTLPDRRPKSPPPSSSTSPCTRCHQALWV